MGTLLEDNLLLRQRNLELGQRIRALEASLALSQCDLTATRALLVNAEGLLLSIKERLQFLEAMWARH